MARQTYTDELVARGSRESERETPEEPFETDDGTDAHGHPDHRQGRLLPEQTRVEESNTRNHDEDQSSSNNDPGDVAEVVDEILLLAVNDDIGDNVALGRVCRVDHFW